MPFSIGQEVSPTFKIIGKVVRVSPQGIGVKFQTLDQDQQRIVTSLLEMI